MAVFEEEIILSNYTADGETKDVFVGTTLSADQRVIIEVDTSNYQYNAANTWENIISFNVDHSDWGAGTAGAISFNWCENTKSVHTRKFGATPETEAFPVSDNKVTIEINSEGVYVNGTAVTSSGYTYFVAGSGKSLSAKIFGSDKESSFYNINYKQSAFTYESIRISG